jgi:hypothetical protein
MREINKNVFYFDLPQPPNPGQISGTNPDQIKGTRPPYPGQISKKGKFRIWIDSRGPVPLLVHVRGFQFRFM